MADKDNRGTASGSARNPGQAQTKRKATAKKKAVARKKIVKKKAVSKKTASKKKVASKKQVTAQKAAVAAFAGESVAKTEKQDKVREKLEDMGVMRDPGVPSAATPTADGGLNLKVEFIFVALLILFLVIFLAVFGGDPETPSGSVVHDSQGSGDAVSSDTSSGVVMSGEEGQQADLKIRIEELSTGKSDQQPAGSSMMGDDIVVYPMPPAPPVPDTVKPQQVEGVFDSGSGVQMGMESMAGMHPGYYGGYQGGEGYSPLPPSGFRPPEAPPAGDSEGAPQMLAPLPMPVYPPQGYMPYQQPWGMPYPPTYYPGYMPPPGTGWRW